MEFEFIGIGTLCILFRCTGNGGGGKNFGAPKMGILADMYVGGRKLLDGADVTGGGLTI